MISAVAVPLEIVIDAPSQPTEVLPLEFSVCVRPVGLCMLPKCKREGRPRAESVRDYLAGHLMCLGQVPTLAPFLALRCDARLWMRWVEPEETGLGGAKIEIAVSTSRDGGAFVARVVARAAVTDRKGAWALYRLAEAQGLVDFVLAGAASPGRNRRAFMHLLVCADLSRRYKELGLSPDPFPQHYS